MSAHSLGGLLTALLFSIAVTWIAHANGFYTLSFKTDDYKLSIRYVIGAFLVYLLTAFIVLPLIYLGISFFLGVPFIGFSSLKNHLPKEQIIPIYLFSFVLIALFLLVYLWIIKKEVVRKVIGAEPFWKNIGFGALTLLVSYPVVLVLNSAITLLADYFFGKSGVEQTSVKELKELIAHPFLFAAMAVVISTVVPFVEELLFRGFLQTYLVGKWGRVAAIVVTSVIFAFAHFSMTQGSGNVELIISLFVLSCYLGFIYERQKSLYASIGLHACFNASTVLGILYTS